MASGVIGSGWNRRWLPTSERRVSAARLWTAAACCRFRLAAPRASRICRNMHSGCGWSGIERRIRNSPVLPSRSQKCMLRRMREARGGCAPAKRQQAAAVQRLAPRSGRPASPLFIAPDGITASTCLRYHAFLFQSNPHGPPNTRRNQASSVTRSQILAPWRDRTPPSFPASSRSR